MERNGVYRSDAPDAALLRRWLALALGLSLLLHGALIWVFRATELERFSPVTERLVPRAFTVKRLEIPENLLDPIEEVRKEPEPKAPTRRDAPPEIQLPTERAFLEEKLQEVRATPAAPEAARPIAVAVERPDAAAIRAAAQETAARDLEKDLRASQEQLIRDQPKVDSAALLPESERGTAAMGRAVGAALPGYSDLDALLAQAGNLRPGTAPILMPTDLLFDYDRADLRPAAVESLRKLGTLIRRNPRSRFIIEGHTDTFGSPAYNFDLSRRRADSVRNWLASEMGVDPAQIETVGYGSTRLLAPGDGSVEAQQLNRRVEVVIRAQ